MEARCDIGLRSDWCVRARGVFGFRDAGVVSDGRILERVEGPRLDTPVAQGQEHPERTGARHPHGHVPDEGDPVNLVAAAVSVFLKSEVKNPKFNLGAAFQFNQNSTPGKRQNQTVAGVDLEGRRGGDTADPSSRVSRETAATSATEKSTPRDSRPAATSPPRKTGTGSRLIGHTAGQGRGGVHAADRFRIRQRGLGRQGGRRGRVSRFCDRREGQRVSH